MKAIQITQADKNNNSTYLKNNSVGDVLTYNGTTYESTIDNNVWSPTVYGWIAI